MDNEEIQHFERRLTQNEQAILNLNEKMISFEDHVKEEFRNLKEHQNLSEQTIVKKLDTLTTDVSSKGKIDWRLATSIAAICFSVLFAVGGWTLHINNLVKINERELEHMCEEGDELKAYIKEVDDTLETVEKKVDTLNILLSIPQ